MSNSVDPDQTALKEQSDLVLHCLLSLVCFFLFDSLRPINNLSVIKGRVFLGLTSIKLG